MTYISCLRCHINLTIERKWKSWYFLRISFISKRYLSISRNWAIQIFPTLVCQGATLARLCFISKPLLFEVPFHSVVMHSTDLLSVPWDIQPDLLCWTNWNDWSWGVIWLAFHYRIMPAVRIPILNFRSCFAGQGVGSLLAADITKMLNCNSFIHFFL
jgi:hypothetical protein